MEQKTYKNIFPIFIGKFTLYREMELHLKNFRCHTDKKFKIPESGLVNIYGASGDGKSTLLSSIVYAFYGKIPGKNKKPYTHGTNTCKVKLYHQNLDMKITRTSRPNRLLLIHKEEEYEDDAAQSVIVDLLGMNYEEFIAGAYIVQRSNASVLSMTPTEQVKFIEILSSTNAEEIKANIKVKAKKTKEKVLGIEGEIFSMKSLVSEAYNNLQEEPEVPKELENEEPNKIRKKIASLEKKIAEVHLDIEKKSKRLEKVRKEDAKHKNIRKKIESLKIQIENGKKDLEAIVYGDISSEEGLKETKNQMQQAKDCLAHYEKCFKLQDKIKTFEEAVMEHEKAIKVKKQRLEKEVTSEEELQALKDNLELASKDKEFYIQNKALFDQQMKAKDRAKKEVSLLFQEIKNINEPFMKDCCDIKKPLQMALKLKELVKIFKSQNPLVCPCCESKLIFNENQLEEVNASCKNIKTCDTQTYIEIFTDYAEKLELYGKEISKKIEDPVKPEEDISLLQKNILKASRLREEYENTLSGDLPPVLQRMKAAIEKDPLYDDAKTTNDVPEDIEKAKEDIESCKMNIATYKFAKESFERIKGNIGVWELNLEDLKGKNVSCKGSKNVKKLEDEISKVTKDIVSINRKISAQMDILDQLKDLEEYQKQLLHIKTLEKKIKKLKKKLGETNALLEGYIGLEDVAKEAEILSMEDVVNSINEHAKIYLDYFFEDPILVRLQCVKELKSKKTTKLQMNTCIDYKGNTYGDIEELSGGERQRCDMAFLLAVNDILGSKILMLDECLNNLDASINTEVLGIVRDLCSEKLVLVISHEAVRGLFDSEITL